jgi:hypothetical protein
MHNPKIYKIRGFAADRRKFLSKFCIGNWRYDREPRKASLRFTIAYGDPIARFEPLT